MTQIPATELPIVIYDCFSNQRFGGNVGGIVLDAASLDSAQMQKIAREINAPVTGFVTGHEGREISVRFFMPGAEIAMCGHVTVGLFTHFAAQGQNSDFVMKAPAGDVNVKVRGANGGAPNVMMQLSTPKMTDPDVDLAALATALGVAPSALETRAPVGGADAGLKHLFVHLETLDAVRALVPDFQKLSEISNANNVQTVACFSMETDDPANTLHIRDFCPAVGVDEVPASGTTNGALAGYLVQHGFVAATSQQILAEQGSEIGRPSLICSEIEVEDKVIKSLAVGGQAVASIKGTLAL